MRYEKLATLASSRNWSELEREWLAQIDQPGADPARLLPVIDNVVKAGQGELAATMGWAWLSSMKEKHSPREALQLGRGLLLRLPDGDQLREEILNLYIQTHSENASLNTWIDKSGIRSGKSVRRALRFLDNGLRLTPGTFLFHRSEDEAAEVTDLDLGENEVTLRTARRSRTLSIDETIEEYDVVGESDFRALKLLHPERIRQLVADDPASLCIGILKGHNSQIDRDALKLLLVPSFIPAGEWSNWWTQLRNAVKKSPNLRIEGRSPMMLIYDPVGQSLEQEAWSSFSRAEAPREWLEILEGYLRAIKEQKAEPDTGFLDRVQSALTGHIDRFRKHKEPARAFATALVIERVAADGLPVSTDAHGMALKMLGESSDPASLVASVPDARLWSLGIACIEQAFSQDWPRLFAELILFAPAGMIDTLARSVEEAGKGDLLPGIVERALADPGRYTDAVMWLWKQPKTKVQLPIPSALELLNLILALVGPARLSEGRAAGQSVNELRARVRAGLGHRNYARFKECIQALDQAMAQTIRRQLERADGLGPAVRDEMLNIFREMFPQLYVRAKVNMWEDESVLYFSSAGLKAKEAEIDELVNVKMRENAKAIGEAASHGDLSENSEYKFALEERDLLRARLAQLNTEISLARVLDPDEVPDDHVSIGQRVTLRPRSGGVPIQMTLLGAGESDIGGRAFSYKTPMAQRVMGKKIGESVTLPVDDREAEFQVERIENALKP